MMARCPWAEQGRDLSPPWPRDCVLEAQKLLGAVGLGGASGGLHGSGFSVPSGPDDAQALCSVQDLALSGSSTGLSPSWTFVLQTQSLKLSRLPTCLTHTMLQGPCPSYCFHQWPGHCPALACTPVPWPSSPQFGQSPTSELLQAFPPPSPKVSPLWLFMGPQGLQHFVPAPRHSFLLGFFWCFFSSGTQPHIPAPRVHAIAAVPTAQKVLPLWLPLCLTNTLPLPGDPFQVPPPPGRLP